MRHEWTLRNELQEQLKLFWAEFLHQLFGYPLSPRKRHILKERARQKEYSGQQQTYNQYSKGLAACECISCLPQQLRDFVGE